jgi:hypothetical protein
MTFNVEIVLRERDYAVTEEIHTSCRPAEWTEPDVEQVLKSMLLAIDRIRNPGEGERFVALRGFSWIVEPASGGVVIAIEIQSGAAVAGPFDVDQRKLDSLINHVLAAAGSARSVIH